MNPFDDNGFPFHVLVDGSGAHSLWPVDLSIPDGWRPVFGPAPHGDCVDYVERNWTDMRPLCLREGRGTPLRDTPASRFADQVRRTPDAIAVEFEDHALTYAQLHRRAVRMRNLLTQSGIGPEHVLAVVLPRSIDLVVTMLAAFQAGAAYLPLDPEYPDARITTMLAAAQPDVLVTTAKRATAFSRFDGRLLLVDTAGFKSALATASPGPLAPVHYENPAYVVFTSGSTGMPKATAMTAGGLMNLLDWHCAFVPGEPGARTAQFTAIGFDFSIEEILSTLLLGKTLVLPTEALRRDLAAFAGWLDQRGVTELYAPTAVLDALFSAADAVGTTLPSLREVFQGGEALHVDGWLREFGRRNGFRLHNVYGPAEVNVATFWTAPSEPDHWPSVAPLGPLIPGVTAQVLDSSLLPAATGELYISGAQVSRGYWRRPGLTACRFVANPAGGRMYRTGDLVRWSSRSELEFLGRGDDQVKLGGIRVEPGEVEAAVLTHPAITQAAVVARRGPTLVAYIVGDVDENALRRFLLDRIPAAMVPSRFVHMSTLERTVNGKVDRNSLPDPDTLPSGRAPETERERVLCGLFGELLARTHYGADEDFFTKGGNSLLAVKLLNKIRSTVDVPLPLQTLLENPTPAALAAVLGGAR